jgi:mannose-6-phosphate isomerase
MSERAQHAIAAVKGWLLNEALPLWLDRGFDAATGSFHERLDFDAVAIPGAPRRLTTQGRQIFVYALATSRGWIDGRERAVTAWDSMVRRYHRAGDQPGWAFSIDAAGAVIDSGRDLYATAFCLLAAAWVHRLTGDRQPIALADETLAHLDATMRAAGGGYVDRVPNPPSALRQNPHMHLFEALLALHEATGRYDYLDRATELYRHFHAVLFRPESTIVAEYFDVGWQPADGANAVWEPGHHFEWAWLLSEYDRLAGTDSSQIGEALMAKAYRCGASSDGVIVDELSGDGTILKHSHRSWPLTEAAKANAARMKGGDRRADNRLAMAFEGLRARHLDTAVAGLWHDHRGPDGRNLTDYVPATTLYHIALSVAVAEDAV